MSPSRVRRRAVPPEPSPGMDATFSTPGADGLGKKLESGAAWSFTSTLFVRLGTLVTGIVLARLLSPSDYGVYAVALVALNLLQSVNELGVSLAVVRWDEDVRKFGPTAATIAILSSLLLYVFCFLASPWFAAALGSPSASSVVRLLCLSVVIDGIVTVPLAVMTREIAARRRLVIEVVNFLVGTTVTLILAVASWGASSLAWGVLAGNMCALVLIYALTSYRAIPGWDAQWAKGLLRFGLPLAASSFLVLTILNVDYIVVGRELGAEQLGLYLLAFNIASWPVNVFSLTARRISLAGFSRIAGERERFARGFERASGVLLTASLPVCLLLVVLAEPLVRFLYGPQWVESAGPLRWLAVLGLLRVELELAYDCLVAATKSRVIVGLQIAWLAVLVPALVVGTSSFGIVGAAAAHVAVVVLVVGPLFAAAIGSLGVSLQRLLKSLGSVLVGAVLLTLVSYLALVLVPGAFWCLVVGGAIGLAVYVPLALPMRRLLPGR